jgi:histidinol-phosphate/aromatic aminotransferase/cobyric acid decarboxylase-like protein
MQARIATQHFFNPETQRALLEKGNGYVNKEEGMRDRIAQIRREHKPEKIAMLNLGENPDGCAPGLQEWIQDQAAGTGMRSYLGGYPESQSNELRVKLSILHNINPEWIMVAAGLDQLIGMIASCFIEPRDRFLVTNPGFFLFEEYCCRLGGVPVELNLPESKGFAWTDDVMEACDEIIRNVNLKLIWIANPNNPTGRRMDDEMLESLVALARARLITVVVDEAYGEYTDPSYGVRSAAIRRFSPPCRCTAPISRLPGYPWTWPAVPWRTSITWTRCGGRWPRAGGYWPRAWPACRASTWWTAMPASACCAAWA